MNDPRNSDLLQKYMDLAALEEDVLFAGRLAEYKYYDMAPTIERAMQLAKLEGL